MKPSLPLVALVAAAAALAMLAAYATVNSDRSYYAYGDITADKEAVNIIVNEQHKGLSAGGQGVLNLFTVNVTKNDDVENVKLMFRIVNVWQLRAYLDYLKIVLNDTSGQVKGVLTLRKPVDIVVLDTDDFKANADGGDDNDNSIVLYGTAYYEAKEGMLFSNLPVIVQVKLLQTS